MLPGKLWLTASFIYFSTQLPSSSRLFVNGVELTTSTRQTDWRKNHFVVSTDCVILLRLSSLFQTSVQFGFQRSLPEAPLVPDHLHDDEDDHRVSGPEAGMIVGQGNLGLTSPKRAVS